MDKETGRERSEDKKARHEERKRMDCKRAGGRENEGKSALRYKSLSATKEGFFFQGQIHLRAPMGRGVLPSSAPLSVTTDS